MRPSQIKVRSLLAVVGVTALVTWWFVDQPRRRGIGIAMTRRVGGVVQFDDEFDPVRPVPLSSPSRLSEWSDEWFGPEFAAQSVSR